MPWAVMLFDFVVFALFTLCASRMGPGCLRGVGLSPFALPGRGGSRFPTLAPGWRAAMPPFPTGAAPSAPRDCQPRAGTGGPAHLLLVLPPSQQDLSWALLAVPHLPALAQLEDEAGVLQRMLLVRR